MNEPCVVGLQPWSPWPLSRWRWWTQPVPAERLAALRIGIALVLAIDILTTYLPHVGDFYGQDSLGSPALFEGNFASPSWSWSLLRGVESPVILRCVMLLWLFATLLLLVGLLTRVSAIVVWVLFTSFASINPSITNAGDSVCGIVLFYLMLCPCGAAWSVDARLWRRKDCLVHPWPLRLLFIQMVLIYFANGVFKLVGPDWQSGKALHYVLGDLTLTRWSFAQVPLPFWLTRALTWAVMGWEVSFPLLVLWRPTRLLALSFGVAFHVSLAVSMELGEFPFTMLCLYLPLIPWERCPRLRFAGPAARET